MNTICLFYLIVFSRRLNLPLSLSHSRHCFDKSMCFWLVSCLLYAMQQCIAPCKWIAIAVNTFSVWFAMHGGVCVHSKMYRCFSFRLVYARRSKYAWPFDWAVIYHTKKENYVERWKNSHPSRANNTFKPKTIRRTQEMSVAVWQWILVSFEGIFFFSLLLSFFL